MVVEKGEEVIIPDSKFHPAAFLSVHSRRMYYPLVSGHRALLYQDAWRCCIRTQGAVVSILFVNFRLLGLPSMNVNL